MICFYMSVQLQWEMTQKSSAFELCVVEEQKLALAWGENFKTGTLVFVPTTVEELEDEIERSL